MSEKMEIEEEEEEEEEEDQCFLLNPLKPLI